ncbi:MAG: RagB/SusD family nutrient uptake outer membrane protein [Bacteroidota bacterium]
MKTLSYLLVGSYSVICILLLGACKKNYLEKVDQGSLNETVLATKDGVNGLLIGAYSLLDGVGDSRGGGENAAVSNWIFGGLASDDAHKGQGFGRNPQQEQLENHTANASNAALPPKWNTGYNGIQRANDVLRLLAKVPNSQLTAEEAMQIKAEAVFLRAVYHFELAKIFWNIPYVDESISFSAGNYNVSNTDPVWPKIEADFQFAADNLTPIKSQIGRANKWSAKAFLGKTLIFEEKFDEAKIVLTDVIQNGMAPNGVHYALGSFADNFNALTKNNSESVFAVQFSVHDGANAQNGNYGDILNYPVNAVTKCCGAYQPSISLANSYKTDPVSGLPLLDSWNDFDITNDMSLLSSDPFTPYTGTLDARLDWTVGRRGIPYLDWGLDPGQAWVRSQVAGGPYLPIKNAFYQTMKDRTNEPFGWADGYNANNYEMIRFADVLLWAAEAEIEAGTLSQAENYVNQVRARAANPANWVKTYLDNNNPTGGTTNTPAANYKVGLYTGQFTLLGKDYARKATHFERKLELAMEGHRFFDLRRYDKGTGSMADELNAYIQHETHIPGWNFLYMNGATFTKGKNELFPIPQQQIDASTEDGKNTLQQNPGY